MARKVVGFVVSCQNQIDKKKVVKEKGARFSLPGTTCN